MQDLKNLSLTKLNERKLKSVTAGCYPLGDCMCACAYRECGGSTKTDNRNANHSHVDGPKVSPQCSELV